MTAAFAGLALANVAAESKNLTLDAGLHLYSGDFGTDEETDITYIPVKLKRTFSQGDVSVSVPYISVTGRGQVTFVTGPVRNQRVRTRIDETTESGLGDTVLRGRLFLLPEGDVHPDVTVGAFVKMPTADEDDGLGTGEFDEGVTIELLKTFAPKYFGLLDLGYTWTGDPKNINYNDRWNVAIGGGYRINADMNVTMLYEEERALLSGEDNPRDIVTYLNISPANSRAGFYAGFLIGLSDGAPDSGIIVGGRVKF